MKHVAKRLTLYLGDKVHKIFEGVTRDLSEIKTFLCWIYAAAYLALIFFCVTTNKDSMDTAIMTTGGIVSAIFTSYVMASSYERIQRLRHRSDLNAQQAPQPQPDQPAGQDDDATQEAEAGD